MSVELNCTSTVNDKHVSHDYNNKNQEHFKHLSSEQLAVEIGTILASIGDKLEERYQKGRPMQKSKDTTKDSSYFLNGLVRTLSVVIVCGWCEVLH